MIENRPPASPERAPGCFLCETLLNLDEGVVADTEYWRVLVDKDQGYLGRCLVLPQRHIKDEQDLSEAEILEFHYLKIALEKAVEDAFGAAMCNWSELGNHAYREEEPNPHQHHHMRPRYNKRVVFAGHKFDDPKWGQMYDLNQRWDVDADPGIEGFKDKVAEAIREKFVLKT